MAGIDWLVIHAGSKHLKSFPDAATTQNTSVCCAQLVAQCSIRRISAYRCASESHLSQDAVMHITRRGQNGQSGQIIAPKPTEDLRSLTKVGTPSYLLRVWRAGRHTQITPEVLPGEQTSDSVDSWCPAEAWTRAGPTASVQRDHRRAIQQQLMCRRRASTPPPRPAHKISNFLKYDQVYERCFESGGGGDPPAHLNDS